MQTRRPAMHAAQSPCPPRSGQARAPGLRLVPAHPGPRRREVESFIRRRFAEIHEARVTRFMPCLFGLQAADDSLHGAVGIRPAAGGPLFLERYLDSPIEEAIRARFGEAVGRGDIVEVGNLAADGRGTARQLIVALADWLSARGRRWVAFTGTPTLVNSFRRLGLDPARIGAADPSRIGAEAAAWGRYYLSGPQVMAGRIPDGWDTRTVREGVAAAPGEEGCRVAGD